MSTLLTGKGTAPRKDHGFQGMTSSIPICWQNSMPPILTIQLHTVGFTHHNVGIFGPQEWPMERWFCHGHTRLSHLSALPITRILITHLTVIYQSPTQNYKNTQCTQSHCLVSQVISDSLISCGSLVFSCVYVLCLLTCILLCYTSSWKHPNPHCLHPTWKSRILSVHILHFR